MVKSCEVEFENNPLKICFTGRRVYGIVFIELDKPMVIKGLRLQILGYAHVHFKWDNQAHRDTITYLDSKIDLINPLSKDGEITLKPGEYAFNFETDIPSNIPSSFEGTYGQIRYKTKIVFIRPVCNQNFCRGFTVINSLNLNTYGPDLTLPVQDEYIKSNCFWPCQKSPLIIEAKIDKCGYVPGENIEVQINITNNTSAEVKELSLKLMLRISYKIRGHMKSKTDKITISESKINLNSFSKNILNGSVKVPPASPTLNKLCEIIELAYQVCVEGKVAGAQSSPRISLPVVIGVIPLGIPALGSTTSNNLEDYVIPPPTYEEASYMSDMSHVDRAEEVTEHWDEEKFIPMFPICNVRGACISRSDPNNNES